ncbi:MAG: DUF6873 family GME fold protein [Bacteroidota bacterium]
MIICDYRASKEAIRALEQFGEVILFNSSLLANSPLCGHPDLFICQTPISLIVAPNTDLKILEKLNQLNSPIIFGENPVEVSHPEIARYNAVVTNKVTICNVQTVDQRILDLSKNNEIIDVKQSYCRCSTLALSDDSFITSDAKTHFKLLEKNHKSLLVSPQSVSLEGYNHGLFGGCGGVLLSEQKVFFMGSLSSIPNQQEIYEFIAKSGLECVELPAETLQDVGGLLFIA